MSSGHQILQAGPLPPALTAGLARMGVPLAVLDSSADELLAQRGPVFTVLVTTGMLGASAALMDRLPGLRAICSLGVGYDAIDIDAAHARGIVISNTPDVLDDCVADLAMGLLIDVVRGIGAADRWLRRGHWREGGHPRLATRVSGKRLGVLGMGRIGQAIARRAVGFDMQIRYHTRSPRPALPWAHEASLQQLAAWCDVLMVACTGGPQTHHLVSAEVLRALGPQGFLVNVARGSVVDERALLQCLQAQALAGAALDVFEHEPQVPEALLRLEQVVLLPHIGTATVETRGAMVDLVLQNLRRYLDEGALVTPVV